MLLFLPFYAHVRAWCLKLAIHGSKFSWFSKVALISIQSNDQFLTNGFVGKICFGRHCSQLPTALISVFWEQRNPCCLNTIEEPHFCAWGNPFTTLAYRKKNYPWTTEINWWTITKLKWGVAHGISQAVCFWLVDIGKPTVSTRFHKWPYCSFEHV